MKNLIFEGAGMDWPETGLNHRIRTRLINKEGRVIYFEMSGSELNTYNSNPFPVTGFVSHCFFDDVPEDAERNYSPDLQKVEHLKCEYTKKGILDFINHQLGCDFDDLVITEDVRVHDTDKALC